MSETAIGMLTVGVVDGLGDATEGARHAQAMLRDVARTLDGITAEQSVTLHREYAEAFGRLKAVTKKIRATGGVVKWSGEADFSKAGLIPPVLCALSEAADKVYKLRKLGAFPADVNLAIDFDKVKAKHADRFNRE